jgi:hypothetical protein
MRGKGQQRVVCYVGQSQPVNIGPLNPSGLKLGQNQG